MRSKERQFVTAANRGIGQGWRGSIEKGRRAGLRGTSQPVDTQDGRTSAPDLGTLTERRNQAAVERGESLDILITNAGVSLAVTSIVRCLEQHSRSPVGTLGRDAREFPCRRWPPLREPSSM